MKKIIGILTFLLITFTTTISNAQGEREPVFFPTQQTKMPEAIQSMVANCTSLHKFVTCPNGDTYFLISGLYETLVTKTDTIFRNGVATISTTVDTNSDEAILIYDNLFNQWKVVVNTPSVEYTMTAPKMNVLAGTIEVTFQNEKESIKAFYRLREKRFIYNSKEDQRKICVEQSYYTQVSF